MIQILRSLGGAFLGIQSSKVHEQDTFRGHLAWLYIVLGFIGTGLLVFALVTLAQWIVKTTPFP